ncbi:hypothetical protein FA95DRAFT_1562849 [Auriscalpium vulgare]|uniref:Uncharacterized protein n=1 Tax=Auriscalpium vulgare TaxID=40419 RepID=A0ACB8RJW9_9AGAM|nr:hypothetical protein FA95DRAFT_1562849 [Auriscalpium vulgare]
MAPPLTTASTSTPLQPHALPASAMSGAAQSANSRARNPSRRRPNDDAAYAGPSTAAKRQAAEKADGETRVKRKRVDAGLAAPSTIGGAMQVRRLDRGGDDDASGSAMDFQSLPLDALHRYLAQYDLIPNVHPSPLSALDPPPPATLLQGRGDGASRAGTPAAITAANRVRRESREQSRRRSSRLVEDEAQGRTPILADVAEVQNVLAKIAQGHFEGQGVKELESLASFMCMVKPKVG